MLSTPATTAQRGVTLIELLVAIVIMGIIAGLAVPAMQTFIQNASIRTAAESILNGLQLARGEAVRRNVRVRFVLGAGSAWTVNEVNADNSTGTQIQSRSGGEGASSVVVTPDPVGATMVTFNSFGRRVGANQLDNVSLDITAGTTRAMQVQIEAGGQIRLCEPAIDPLGVDVRRCLP